MRAIRCEGCQRPQPKDWTAGQRCVHCGGAVRADVRCAACTRWTPSARFCRHCAAELVPEAWYGVGRMLVQAGVDGLSLAARVAALDEGQRETFSSRFARQRANVERAVSLARCCEAGFLTTGHADALEDELVASLPLDEASAQALSSLPPGPHSRGDGVAAAFAQTVVPRLRVLAAIARLRDGEARDPVASLVVGALDASGALGVEAAVALGLAAVASGRDVVPPWQRDAFEQAVARARVELPDSVEVALVFAEGLAHQTPASALADALEAAGVTTLLRDALARPRSEVVHFGAARRLDDARALDAFVTHPRYGDAALRALRSVAPGRIVARLVRSTEDDQRRRLLTSVPHPLDDEAARALAGLLPHCGQRLRDDVLRRLCERPFDELPPDALAPLEAFLAGQTLPPERALDLVEWAVTPRERGQPWRQAAAVRPFADHAARALAPLPPTRETLDRSGVTAFLSVAQQGPAFDVLLGWLRVPEAAERALRALAWLQGMLDAQSPSPDDRGLALTVSAWAALDASSRRALAPTLAEVLRREVSGDARARWARAVFERFLVADAEERELLWTAGASLREALEAVRDADPRALDLDGGAPARRFAVYGGLAPLEAPPLLRRTLERHEDDPAVRALTPAVYGLVEQLLERSEHRHALWLAGSWMSEVGNRFRSDETREAWREAALGLSAFREAVEAARRRTTPKDPHDDLATFEGQMATEARMVAEALAREATERERAAAHEVARSKAEAEREATRRRALEAAAAREAAARAADTAREDASTRDAGAPHRAPATREGRVTPTAGPLALQSEGASTDTSRGDGLEHEVLLRGQPLPTLAAYVGFLRALRSGADVMALFEQHGLTPATWAACAGAWSTLLSQRLDLVVRFGQLMQ